MRTFTVLSSVLLFSALTFGQGPGGPNWRGIAGYCPYGCAPYIPLLTTPSLSFATVSPDPVGATDATGELTAGATDSTLSEPSGDTSAVFTRPVWYSGGQTPLIAPLLSGLAPMKAFAHERWARSQRNVAPLEAEFQPEQMTMGERTLEPAWIYFSSAQQTGGEPAAAIPGNKAVRASSNADVDRQNQQNGLVKYDSKTEKIQ
jgi:hypothetical protein